VTSCGTKPIANDFIAEAGEHGVFYGLDFVTPCGEVWTVDKQGAIAAKIQALEFANGSTLHGFATTPDLKYMYLTVCFFLPSSGATNLTILTHRT
jgi:carboxy-cis,cis-muconate cyclase